MIEKAAVATAAVESCIDSVVVVVVDTWWAALGCGILAEVVGVGSWYGHAVARGTVTAVWDTAGAVSAVVAAGSATGAESVQPVEDCSGSFGRQRRSLAGRTAAG